MFKKSENREDSDKHQTFAVPGMFKMKLLGVRDAVKAMLQQQNVMSGNSKYLTETEVHLSSMYS